MQWRIYLIGVVALTLLFPSYMVSASSTYSEKNVIRLTLGQIRPTQSVIAHEQVNYKLSLYQQQPATLFADLCQNSGWGKKVTFNQTSKANQPASFQCQKAGKKTRRFDELKTVVRGPDEQYYLTDGHHAFSTFFDMPDGGADLQVDVLLLNAEVGTDMSSFWQKMQQLGYAWLYDAAGKSVNGAAMPEQLGRASLANDPYRAALYFLRDTSWLKPDPAIPFVEFYWAQHLRQQSGLEFPGYYQAAEYLQWLERIHAYLAGITAKQQIYGKYRASDLGWRGGWYYPVLNQLLCERNSTLAKPGKLGIALVYRGMAIQCDQRQFLDRGALSSGFTSFPSPLNADGSINVLIEISAGGLQKWQQNKSSPLQLEWEKSGTEFRQIRYLPYPVNYGIVSGTLLAKDKGGDGDPLDILVLGAALPPATIHAVRLIGVMRMTDQQEQDDKLLAVPMHGLFSEVMTLAQLDQQYPGVSNQLKLWFEGYKGRQADVQVHGFEDSKPAMALLKSSIL